MFNHQARWDRALPNDTAVQPETPIATTCLMEKGRLIPQSFAWNGRFVPITKINFFWKDKKGREALFFFSVTTPQGTFEITFSQEKLTWHLIRLLGP